MNRIRFCHPSSFRLHPFEMRSQTWCSMLLTLRNTRRDVNTILRSSRDSQEPRARRVDPVWVWGVPFASLSMAETVSAIGDLIEAGRPTFFIHGQCQLRDADLRENPDLHAINERAAFIVADGAPFGLGFAMARIATAGTSGGFGPDFRGERRSGEERAPPFFLGGAEGVAAQAVLRLCEHFPGLQIAGCESPPFRELSVDEQVALAARIRAARPDILFRGHSPSPRESAGWRRTATRWGFPWWPTSGRPSTLPPGAFAAPRVGCRTVAWKWAFRLGVEPRRLVRRYARNAWFIARMVARDVRQATSRSRTHPLAHARRILKGATRPTLSYLT